MFAFSCLGPGMSNLVIRSGPALELDTQARVSGEAGAGISRLRSVPPRVAGHRVEPFGPSWDAQRGPGRRLKTQKGSRSR